MGLFNLFRKKQRSTGGVAQAMSMVLLPEAKPPSGEAILRHLVHEWSDLPSIAGIEVSGNVTTLRIHGGGIALAHMPVPVPKGELDGPAAVAWHWPTAASEIARHKSHMIVHTISTALDSIDLRLLHTKAIASTLFVSQGIGAYIGDAMLVRAADGYVAEAKEASRTSLPMLLWVGFNPVSEDGMVSAYTTGLINFGLRELEIRRSTRPAQELLGLLADTAYYQINTGQTLEHGQTFGETAFDRTSVTVEPSAFLPEADVTVLHV